MSTSNPLPLIALCCTLAAAAATAQPIAITNAGFEANFTPRGNFRILVPTAWTLYDPNNIIDSTNDAVGVLNPAGTPFFPAGSPEGNNAALVYLAGDVGTGPVGLRQTLTATLQPNSRYVLTVEVGNIASGRGLPPQNEPYYNLAGFPGYAVQLRANGIIIAQDNNSLGATIPEGVFQTSTVAANIGATHPLLGRSLEVWLLNLNHPGTPAQPAIEVDFDRVRLERIVCPMITHISDHVQACIGGEASFSVTAAGTPPLGYQWRHNGTPIPAAAGGALPTLTFQVQSIADAGTYDCMVTNPCGSVFSPPDFLAICIGDFNCDGGIDGADIGSFFVAWEAGESTGDVNADGGVDGSDVELFIVRWEEGC